MREGEEGRSSPWRFMIPFDTISITVLLTIHEISCLPYVIRFKTHSAGESRQKGLYLNALIECSYFDQII